MLAANLHLKLRIQFQVNGETPVVRFRYTLNDDKPYTLTTPAGENRLTYFETSLRQYLMGTVQHAEEKEEFRAVTHTRSTT
ncbi:MAG: hypothetical protein ABI076_09535 [Acidobacteriaceae bacterium]